MIRKGGVPECFPGWRVWDWMVWSLLRRILITRLKFSVQRLSSKRWLKIWDSIFLMQMRMSSLPGTCIRLHLYKWVWLRRRLICWRSRWWWRWHYNHKEVWMWLWRLTMMNIRNILRNCRRFFLLIKGHWLFSWRRTRYYLLKEHWKKLQIWKRLHVILQQQLISLWR